MKVQLTDLVVKNLAPPKKGQRTVRDTLLSGFAVRVSQGGSKTFIVVYGQHRKQVTIGRYPIVSLSEARQKAKELLYQVTVYGEEGKKVTWDEAVESFLKHKQLELRQSTVYGYKNLLRRNFAFSGIYLKDIQTGVVVGELDKIRTQSEKTHAYTAIKVFFNWCIDRQYIKSNPLARVKKPKVPTARDRVLTDEELKLVWEACHDLGKYGAIVRLLIITGQRCNQIGRLQERWIKGSKIEFPAEVMKNGEPHSIPYGRLSKIVISGVDAIEGYYFAPEGLVGHPFSAWSKNKKKLDEMIAIDPWTLHDLRRTWSTNAARLDIPPHITDRILSHTTGTLSPVARIYNRWKYEDEMVEAVNRMDSHIIELIS